MAVALVCSLLAPGAEDPERAEAASQSSSSTLDADMDEWTELAFVRALCQAFGISDEKAMGLDQVLQCRGGAEPASFAQLLLDEAAIVHESTGAGEATDANLRLRWMVCWGILVVAVVPRCAARRLCLLVIPCRVSLRCCTRRTVAMLLCAFAPGR